MDINRNSRFVAVMDEARQQAHLNGVSRTFALTIPMLPSPLSDFVGNAYLLCRIADTVEDDPQARPERKAAWLEKYSACAQRAFADDDLIEELRSSGLELSLGAVAAERQLMAELPQLLARTRSFPPFIVQALGRGVSIMSEGMAKSLLSIGVDTLDDLDSYCYFVAGVVGETLACLFAHLLPGVRQQDLMDLSVSFGEGLQLTNILKDEFKDSKRGARFLPVDHDEAHYVELTKGHLDDALDFVLRLPPKEKGTRRFCLLNITMAAATLRQIASGTARAAPKITRAKLRWLCRFSRFSCGSNLLTRWFYSLAARGLRSVRRDPVKLRNRVSRWNESAALDAGL